VAPGSPINQFGIDAHDQLDVFGSWRFTDRITMRGGIDNVTNEDPEIVGATTVNNNLGTTNSNYDQFGRRVFFGLTIALSGARGAR
jgi:outer membrane receptor protein involved in Fe transport